MSRPRAQFQFAFVLAAAAFAGFFCVPPARADIARGRVVVAFDGPSRATRFLRDRAAPLGLRPRRNIARLDAAVLTVPAGEERAWAERLAREPGVVFAEPDAIVRAARAPNDPIFPQQWNHHTLEGATGADAQDQPTQAEHFWNWRQDSENRIIAVLDSGADTTHPDLEPNLFKRLADKPDGRDEDGNGFPDDTRGWNFIDNNNDVTDNFHHGTEISGALGAVGDNGIGVAGVLWKTQMLEVKILDGRGEGTASSVAEGILYAVDAGACILNMSLSSLEDSRLMHDALLYAQHHNVIAVVAAGNNGLTLEVTPAYPAAYSDLDNVVAVASSTQSGGLAVSSNRGQKVLLAAPGEGIWTTRLGGGYLRDSGTSIAAPQVAGAAALYWTLRPWENYHQVVAALGAGVRQNPRLMGQVASGGVLDLRRLLEEALGDSFPPAPITDLRITSRRGQDVTLAWTAPGEDGRVGRAEAYEIQFSRGPDFPGQILYASTQLSPGQSQGDPPVNELGGLDKAYAAAPPRPGFGGTTDTVVIRNIPYGSSRAVTISAVDRVHNHSTPSDTVVLALGLPPTLQLSVDRVAFDLRADANGTKRFRIYNRGGNTLTGTLQPFDTSAVNWNLVPLAIDFAIAPGDSANISLTVTGSELLAGDYTFAGRIRSNDPTHPVVSLPIDVHVQVASPGPGRRGAARDSAGVNPVIATRGGAGSALPDFHLRVTSPSPGCAPVRFELGRRWTSGVGLRARIVDVSGRTVTASLGSDAGGFVWEGKQQTGAPAPAGLYFLVIESGDRRAVLRFVKL